VARHGPCTTPFHIQQHHARIVDIWSAGKTIPQKALPQKALRAGDISKFQATKLIIRSKVPTRRHETVLEERLPISNAIANLNS
jgi:hypothetical protein